MAKGYTTTEVNEIRNYYMKDLLSVEEIAELTGRTKQAISALRRKNNWHRSRSCHSFKTPPIPLPDESKTPKIMVEDVAPVKTLSDFTPREIIKHLYNLGYRIEDGKLVCIVHQVVNVKDIING